MARKIDSDRIKVIDLFSNFWFTIPNYQRHYVWQEDDVRALLEDLWEHHKRNSRNEEYFLGSLVLRQHENTKDFDVLDGQQRLTTLLLILAVFRDKTNNLEECQNFIHQEASRTRRLDDIDRIKFEIRDNIGKFTSKFIFEYNETTDINPKYEELKNYTNSKNISIKNLSTAMITIKNFLDNIDSEEVVEYYTSILNEVIFIYVSTESEDDAFRLFTILNSRGVPLSSADILKSLNLGEIPMAEREKYAKKWEDIECSFNEDEFDRFLSHLRAILVGQRAKVNLLKEFESIVYNKNNPLLRKGVETLDFIEKYYNIYKKIILLDSIDENGCENDLPVKYKNLVTILNLAFTSTDWIPPLLVYYKKFGSERLLEFLSRMEEKALCDMICRESTTRRMDSFYKIQELINNSNTPSDILDTKGNVLENVTKSIAESIIKKEGIYGRAFDKYILLKYEYLNLDDTAVISEYSNLSIEHVLPQYPNDSSQWKKDFNEEERDFWTDNIANLILINGRKNSSLSNLDFKDKQLKLKLKINDAFKGSFEVLAKQKWTPDVLENRLNDIIKILF